MLPNISTALGLLLAAVPSSSMAFILDKSQRNLKLLKQFYLKSPFLNHLGYFEIANSLWKPSLADRFTGMGAKFVMLSSARGDPKQPP